jgi:UDPglucose 6-dehydrogenase
MNLMPSRPSILVVGAGYVGLATAVFLAKHGYPVTVVEKNHCLLNTLRLGRLHFLEPKLEKKLRQALRDKTLRFNAPIEQLYRDAQIIFIAIDSAHPSTGKMRLTAFKQIAEWIGGAGRTSNATVVLKSTNVIGFAEKFQRLLSKTVQGERIRLVVNPEFLREGYAYDDTANPWRIVIGVDRREAAAPLLNIYKKVYDKSIPVIVTDWKSAELIKLAANVYLSYRLAFVHEIADFARIHNLDMDAIRRGIGLDPRIGLDYFAPGLGFGGSCLPKDCLLINSADIAGDFRFKTARTALAINERVLDLLIVRLQKKLGQLKSVKIVILGAAFKPGVDDIRSSQAVKLGERLKKLGAQVFFFDSFLNKTGKEDVNGFPLAQQLDSAVNNASAVVIGTAHREFRSLKPERIAKLVSRKLVCDYFGLLPKKIWMKQGFEFI